jgi:hypothetical protein
METAFHGILQERMLKLQIATDKKEIKDFLKLSSVTSPIRKTLADTCLGGRI